MEKKKLQGEKHVAERCLKECLYVGLLVPENIEIGNVYEISVPKKPWYLRKEESRMPEVIIEAEDIAVVEKEAVVSVDLNSFDMELEPDEIEKAVYGDVEPQMKVVTKEIYESMTDKEKAEWIGIDGNDVYGSMKRFHEKMTSIGISYQYSSDETEEFCRLEEICRKESDRSKFYRNKETSR